MIDNNDLPHDKKSKELVLTGARLILTDIFNKINEHDLTVTQVKGLISNNIEKIEGMLE